MSQFESRDLEADLWLLATPTMRRAESVHPHLRARSAQVILKNLGREICSMAKLVYGSDQSLDGYVDHQNFYQVPRSSVTSSSMCVTWPPLSTVASFTR